MAKVIGNTTATPNPQADWNQTDATKADYIKNKPIVSQGVIEVDYATLCSLRANAELIPGQFYRIIDYQCTSFQEGTRAVNNITFDIIVQALSSSDLSENASADYHYVNECMLSPDVIADETYLVPNTIEALYYVYEDSNGTDGFPNTPGEYKANDIFIGYGYDANPDGIEVPIIYKTDSDYEGGSEYETPDYDDAFYYVGTEFVYGEECDKWIKIENSEERRYHWNTDNKAYVYTNKVVIISEKPKIPSVSKDLVNIPAWEIKYSLDNDTDRFVWALNEAVMVYPPSGFAGGIHIIRQPSADLVEPNDAYPDYTYAWGTSKDVADGDTSNFVYSRNPVVLDGEAVWSDTAGGLVNAKMVNHGKGVIYYMKDEHGNECPYDFKNIQFKRGFEWQDNHSDYMLQNCLGPNITEWFYTFSAVTLDMQRIEECTMSSRFWQKPQNNTIKDVCIGGQQELGSNIFLHSAYTSMGCEDNVLGFGCFENSLSDGSCNILQGGSHNNILCCETSRNIFEFNNYGHFLGSESSNNHFGQNCTSIELSYGCFDNVFGNGCGSIGLNEGSCNRFGACCEKIYISEQGSDNIFEDNSGYIGVATSIHNVHIETNCEYIQLDTAGTHGVNNIRICHGVHGTADNLLTIDVPENDGAQIIYRASNTTEIILDV